MIKVTVYGLGINQHPHINSLYKLADETGYVLGYNADRYILFEEGYIDTNDKLTFKGRRYLKELAGLNWTAYDSEGYYVKPGGEPFVGKPEDMLANDHNYEDMTYICCDGFLTDQGYVNQSDFFEGRM